jgi:Mlc titration factor MtfA (ptsG expression regulator)
MWSWLKSLAGLSPPPSAASIPDALWLSLLGNLPFLAALSSEEQQQLRSLAAGFLADKEFHGAGGITITDAMALSIAAQACLPLLHLRPPGGPRGRLLDWYADFVGIVVHPGEVVARREAVDDATGVVHHYNEVLSGEAMQGGPVMLSWDEVARAGEAAAEGANVVIHEFIHKIAMYGNAGGQAPDDAPGDCPPLPAGFMGTTSARAAMAAWFGALLPAYEAFREKVIIAERFSGAPTWLDPYGAESIDEFFPVACEAYFVNRERFSQEFPALMPVFDGFFRQR